jgi:CheY-like chemotaxis protein
LHAGADPLPTPSLNDMSTIPPDSHTSRPPEATHTILIVDDNQDMVDSVAAALAPLGYSTIPAYSAREACDLLDEVRNIDLVLTDVRMPDVDGFDLLRVLRHRFHSLPVILMSGFPIGDDDIVPSGASILQKPFAMDELRRLVQQKLTLRTTERR